MTEFLSNVQQVIAATLPVTVALHDMGFSNWMREYLIPYLGGLNPARD